MPLPTDDCDECTPASLTRRSLASPATALSTLPFLLTFLLTATLLFQRLFPLLSPTPKPLYLPRTKSTPTTPRQTQTRLQRLSALTFSATLALAAVLAELILCEISDTLDPRARGLALRLTLVALLTLVLLLIPSLEIHALLRSLGWSYTGASAGRLRLAWVLHAVLTGGWLFGFWASGQAVLGRAHGHEHGVGGGPQKSGGPDKSDGEGMGYQNESLLGATTEHVGVIGISLMALLAGFASVSAPWQSFGPRRAAVSEAGLERKKVGLESTRAMLGAKRARLRAVEMKLSAAPAPEGLLKKATGMFRGNADVAEKRALEMEVWGLENMETGLQSGYALLESRWRQQVAARTARGKVLGLAGRVFSAYCLYRIVTTALTFARRHWFPSPTFVGSDPINNILALLVKTYDSHLDRQAWTRQISFLLSSGMLLASISSVLQTFHFFARYMPGLMRAAQANLALLVAQVGGTYVISVALLLRGIMPGDVVGERLRSLGGEEMGWVDGWFEGWFLGGVIVTVVGIWVSKQIGGWDDDDEEDLEMGKVS